MVQSWNSKNDLHYYRNSVFNKTKWCHFIHRVNRLLSHPTSFRYIFLILRLIFSPFKPNRFGRSTSMMVQFRIIKLLHFQIHEMFLISFDTILWNYNFSSPDTTINRLPIIVKSDISSYFFWFSNITLPTVTHPLKRFHFWYGNLFVHRIIILLARRPLEMLATGVVALLR